MDDTDATVPVPDIPAAATRDSAIDDQQCGSVTCVLQRSWEDLYKAEMPRLVRYLMKCFGDSGMRDAADAAHNAFVELFTNWDTVRSPRAWLRTVAFRQMLRQNASAEYPLDMLRQEPATVPASARLELRRGNAGSTARAAPASAGTAASARPDIRRVFLRRDRADHRHKRGRGTEERGKSETQNE